MFYLLLHFQIRNAILQYDVNNGAALSFACSIVRCKVYTHTHTRTGTTTFQPHVFSHLCSFSSHFQVISGLSSCPPAAAEALSSSLEVITLYNTIFCILQGALDYKAHCHWTIFSFVCIILSSTSVRFRLSDFREFRPWWPVPCSRCYCQLATPSKLSSSLCIKKTSLGELRPPHSSRRGREGKKDKLCPMGWLEL